MKLKLEQGTTVKTVAGDTAGKIERIVIDPSDHQVTHVVIEKGFLFSSDYVIPIEAFMRVDTEELILKESIEDVKQFPKFEETYYVTPNVDHLPPQWGGRVGAPLFYYPPVNPEKSKYYSGIGYPIVKKEKRTSRNVPAETIVIGEDTQVITPDGDHVGHIEKTFTDADGNLTHILISNGLFSPTERLIPMQWVSQMSDSEVTLNVVKNIIENLPEYAR